MIDAPFGAPEGQRQPARTTRKRTNLAIVLGSLALAAVLIFHTLVPDVAGLGLLVDNGLPWLGLLIIPLVLASFLSRKGKPWLAIGVPVLVWALLFVPGIVPHSGPALSANTLTVASQNVAAESGTAAESATALAATGANVIALQEMDADAIAAASDVLDEQYPYSFSVGTVGVWSTMPLINAQAWDLGLGWQRAVAADIETPTGLVSIYVLHAPSARPWSHDDRDTVLHNLADVLPNDLNERVIVVGDFNATVKDRALSGISDLVSEPNQSGGGFGFTWPASAPIARLDHLMQKGMTVASNTTLKAGDSDHLAILTTLNLD